MQRNVSQIKEEDKITVRDLSETNVSNIPEREFKVTVIKTQDLRVENVSKTLNKEIETIKKNQSKMKNSINKI